MELVNIAYFSFFVSSNLSVTLTTLLLFLDGVKLELVAQYKYLGVVISSNLQWTPHINQICSNARKLLGLIYRNFASNIQSTSIVLHLYLSLVRPCLEYASQVWDPYLLKDIRKLRIYRNLP